MSRIIVAACTLLFAFSAQAEVPWKSFYLGVYGGGHLTLTSWHIHENGLVNDSPDHTGTVGIRFGGLVHPLVALEAGVGVIPYTSAADDTNIALNYSADLHLLFFEGNWVPFLDLGAGFYHNVSGDHGSDIDYHVHYGLGLRGMLTDWMALRIDVRHLVSDGFLDELAHNLEVTVGLDFFLWTETHIYDTDGDGIMDPDDVCPKVKGPKATGGCPDRDGDGIKDSLDKCPDDKGTEAHAGCPDTDGDGIIDRDDKCPKVKGLAALGGCPDADGDGITDAEDKCPKVKGPKKHAGCPDTDGDGIIDRDDKCPRRKGVPEEKGCPFVPKEIRESFSGTLEGIFFKTGKATIRKKSFPVLDQAAEALLKYDMLRLRVEGHTDDRGSDEKNKALSQARADSVREYLMAKGIAADRLVAVGYGEEKPVASNKTRKGRAQNRRIEFRIIER